MPRFIILNFRLTELNAHEFVKKKAKSNKLFIYKLLCRNEIFDLKFRNDFEPGAHGCFCFRF